MIQEAITQRSKNNLNTYKNSSNKRNCSSNDSFGGKSHDRKKRCLAFRVETVSKERQT